MTSEEKELVEHLKMPHRVANRGALNNMCFRAAELIEKLAAKQPAPKKARATKKSD